MIRRFAFAAVLALVLLCDALVAPAGAAEARIRKVLPHLMDEKGRISVAPGLFDRDGYQQMLRLSPERVSGVRFDIQWSAPREIRDSITLRLELRTARGEPGKPLILEMPARDRRRWGGWSAIVLGADDYRRAGEVLAWRVLLLDGSREIAEQRSFLW
ncbi:MAG: hypothetical protein KIT22_11590 [Verrucomicrobiae bacterium]|nr:hypothetical protein [Verrucomicrobiae bacterium]